MVSAGLAQDSAPLKLTLRDAVALALKQNPQVVLANLDVARSEQDRMIARSTLLPQAGASVAEAVHRVNLEAAIGLNFPGGAPARGPVRDLPGGLRLPTGVRPDPVAALQGGAIGRGRQPVPGVRGQGRRGAACGLPIPRRPARGGGRNREPVARRAGPGPLRSGGGSAKERRGHGHRHPARQRPASEREAAAESWRAPNWIRRCSGWRGW